MTSTAAGREVGSRQRRCSRKGCTKSFPDHKFGAIRAVADGWFLSRETGDAWCPDDLPDWVPAWRAKKAAEQFQVDGSWGPLPAVLKCEQGDLADVFQPDPDPEAWTARLREAAATAFEHGRHTGHVVTLISARVLTVSPK